MKQVCSKHEQAYDSNTCCPWCDTAPAPPAKPVCVPVKNFYTYSTDELEHAETEALWRQHAKGFDFGIID